MKVICLLSLLLCSVVIVSCGGESTASSSTSSSVSAAAIVDNYDCQGTKSVMEITNTWQKNDYKEGNETLTIMSGELCECFCQIKWDLLSKENIETRLDADFMDYQKADDPVVRAFTDMIACKNYLRGDRGGYSTEDDWYTVIDRFAEQCPGVNVKRLAAQKRLKSKVKEMAIISPIFNPIIE